MTILICKKTGKEFSDTENKSGAITRHLYKIGIEVPSSYKRRKYLRENGVHWHEMFFEKKIADETKDKLVCRFCSWDTCDIENKSGAYTKHLKNKHNKSIGDYVKQFKEDSHLFKTEINRIINKEETKKNGGFVLCKICSKKLRYITNTHLKKHNITPEEYKLKFGIENYASRNFKEKTRKNLQTASKKIKKSFVSKPEKDLQYFIKEFNLNTLNNNRAFFDGIEIDIIIPSKKICFEFNGNLYHSENYGKKGKYYHLDKTEICKEKGYRLIHIMEDEWFLKNDIVKEKIRHILGFGNKESIYARKCEIREIGKSEKNDFLNKNHIQGEDRSSLYLGAFYKDKLVSVITFSDNIKANKKKGLFEIKRFASDINFNVVGVFSKFIKFFERNYEFNELYTFLDIRWNPDEKNNLYSKNGFSFSKKTYPDYTYYNSKISRYKRFHKFGFSKTSIKKRFNEYYSENKTEWEIMQDMGYDRIWDCGKYKFILNR
jgi:very-short-patch-repair endonuclease